MSNIWKGVSVTLDIVKSDIPVAPFRDITDIYQLYYQFQQLYGQFIVSVNRFKRILKVQF